MCYLFIMCYLRRLVPVCFSKCFITFKAIKICKHIFIATQMHVRGILIHVITCMTDSKQE